MSKFEGLNYNVGIKKIMRGVHPSNSLTGKTTEYINMILKILGKRIINECNVIVKSSGKNTINLKDVENATEIVFVGELSTQAVREAHKYLVKVKNNPHKLVLSRARTETLMRDNSKYNISKSSTIFLTAVLEYLCVELCELSGNVAKNYKKTRITPNYLHMSIMRDAELKKLIFEKLNIRFADNSLVVSIVERKINKGVMKKIKSQNGTFKSHDCVHFPKASFKKLIKKKIGDNKLVSEQSSLLLQYYIEQYLTHQLYKANHITLKNNRKVVTQHELQLIR